VRVGVVANTEDPEAGFVEERLDQLGASFVRKWRGEPSTLDALERNVDLLVLLGSDWSVYDPTFSSSIAAERALVRRATEVGCPTLGICFGGQLIASALGLTVERAPLGEVGWGMIESDLPDLFGNGPWFQYHLDRWTERDELPASARNALAPQAIVRGRTLGVQFHPEVTADVIERWVRGGSDDVALVGATADAILADTERLIEGSRSRCHALVDAFLDRLATLAFGSPTPA
jgi:GMP synthase-like glutamine amidotransferase